MGTCSGTANVKTTQINKALKREKRHNQYRYKLLLLGAGEGGKSTIFKQLVSLYGEGFPDAARTRFVGIVKNNMITDIQALCRASHSLAPVRDMRSLEALAVVEALKGDTREISEELAHCMAILWKDQSIRATYGQRAMFQLSDSAGYFLDKLDEVVMPRYLPTEDDVMRSRVRTTGIHEMQFTLQNNSFDIFDMGGQRAERKKWIHCFEHVTAVIFVASLSEYDQRLLEDPSIWRMEETFKLWAEICNAKWFVKTAMILFLNKNDLFMKKLPLVPFKNHFRKYKGNGTYDDCLKFMESEFKALNDNPDKQVFVHITCATDRRNVTAVFNDVKDILITRSLATSGLG